MSTAMESTGLVLCIISWLITGASLVNDYWQISSKTDNIINSQRYFLNLWHSCTENSAGVIACQDFQSMLEQPAHIQACRALMIISVMLGLISIIVSLFGMRRLQISSATDETKAKITLTGGIISFPAGICSLTACSWYAYRVVQEFYMPNIPQRYELGTGLFLGWAGATLAILGGGLLCSAMTRIKSNAKKGGYYGKAPQKIYTATTKPESDTAKSFV